jgi:thymidine kinase
MTYYVPDITERLFQHLLGCGEDVKILLVHGPMGSGKSTMALRLVERLAQCGQSPLCIVAGIKRREAICARQSGRISAYPSSIILNRPLAPYSWEAPLIIDEAQFLTSTEVDSLSRITEKEFTPALCFGLCWDADGALFQGTKSLLDAGALAVPIPHNLRCQCGEPAIADVLVSDPSKHTTRQYANVCGRHSEPRSG